MKPRGAHSPLRAAVVGCGRIGATYADAHPDVGVCTHAGAYQASGRTELTALYDAEPERALAAARAHGARYVVPSLEQLAALQPAIVSVATPTTTHLSVVEALLRTRSLRALIVEKPLAPTLADAEQIVRLARTRGVTLAVCYQRRFAPVLQQLREDLAGGLIGDLRHVSGLYTGGLVHNGTHLIDLASMLAGAISAAWVDGRVAGSAPSDSPTLALQFANGASGRLVGLDARDYTVFELELVGTRGRVRLTDSGGRIELEQARASERRPGYVELTHAEHTTGALRDALLHVVDDVVEACLSGRPAACSGDDGLAALRLACDALAGSGAQRSAA